MSFVNGLPANFTISDEAREALERLKRWANEREEGSAAQISIAWGIYSLNSGKTFEDLTIGFYPESMYEEMKYAIETVSGFDLIFFITEEYYDRFAGKVLDYDPDQQRYFLR